VLYPLSYGGLKVQVRASPPQEAAGRTVASAIMAAAKKRVLVCDDDPVILRLLQVNLELEGYDVLLAHHGEEAVEVSRAERLDLVILDIMMPRMDGYQACEAIKSEESTKDIPIVFLSAKAQQSDIDKGKAHGVDDYLTKPFDPAELIEVVERLTA
jgi:CheY-like chemotaxis protein